MNAARTCPHLLRRDTRVMLQFAAYMADLARLQLERIAESSETPDERDIKTAENVDRAIEAIDAAKRELTE